MVLNHKLFNPRISSIRYIHSHNRKHVSYTMASNHLADLTSEEMVVKRGRLHTTGYNGGLPFTYTKRELNSAPKSLGKSVANLRIFRPFSEGIQFFRPIGVFFKTHTRESVRRYKFKSSNTYFTIFMNIWLWHCHLLLSWHAIVLLFPKNVHGTIFSYCPRGRQTS